MRRATGALAALLVSTGLGCVHPSVVERAYGGDVIAGHYVSPEAYAAFLRGAIAEAEHHPVDALKAYVEAAERDPASPEPWTRMAEVWCSPGQGGAADAERALAHALELDASYARAWAVRAACAASRSDAVGEGAAAARAAQLDPQGDGANILLARADDTGPAAAKSRELLVALTVTAVDRVAAWSALASWAEAHGDVALWTRALIVLARVAPERREAVAHSAEELAGAGDVGEARMVAAAALEASESPLPPRFALAARLALDEAIARHDAGAVRRRATRVRRGVRSGRAWCASRAGGGRRRGSARRGHLRACGGHPRLRRSAGGVRRRPHARRVIDAGTRRPDLPPETAPRGGR
jgi:hypothetical protein